MLEEVRQLASVVVAEIAAAQDDKALEALRVHHLGRKSRLRQIARQIGHLPAAQRPALGEATGRAQQAIQQALDDKALALRQMAESASALDVTLPGRRPLLGCAHPLSQLTDELIGIFQGMGFDVADGPEAEDEYHNFDALNTPADHPARDLHDTFYLAGGGLMRTHTSTVQIRVMEQTPAASADHLSGSLLPQGNSRCYPPLRLPPDRGPIRRPRGLFRRLEGHH